MTRPCNHFSYDMTGQCFECGTVDHEARAAHEEDNRRHAEQYHRDMARADAFRVYGGIVTLIVIVAILVFGR